MLKHNDIISQLSEQDKIRLLSDIRTISGELHEKLDIPVVNVARIESFCGCDLPSPIAMANTWDKGLISAVAHESARRARAEGVNFLEVPGPKVKINPYHPGLSEDALLASAVTEEYANAVADEHVACGVRALGVLRDEIEFLDEAPDTRFINEYLLKPFYRVASVTDVMALIPYNDVINKNYEKVNMSILQSIESASECTGKYFLYNRAKTEQTVPYLKQNATLIEGSALALESAFNNYKKLKKAVDSGGALIEQLAEELESGKAISAEDIDAALDRMLDFAFAVNGIQALPDKNDTIDRETVLRAVLESVVLLKNSDGVLPMKSGRRICIIGDIASYDKGNGFVDSLGKLLEEKGYEFVGFSRGYDLESERDGEDFFGARDLARGADIILLFLGLGEDREGKAHKTSKVSIPANQQELLLSLGGIGAKIVAITPPEVCADIVLPQRCDAILNAPIDLADSAKALSMILSGEFSPCGRLASTVYTSTDKSYLGYKTMRVRDGMKVSMFTGYRYYDTAGEEILFPFGHGLGYVPFKYSGISVKAGKVSFYVKNMGRMKASETVQVYIGKNGSGILRPQKELCSFFKLELAPSEKKRIEFDVEFPTVYDAQRKEFVTEEGDYTVYIGASVSDIRLVAHVECTRGVSVSDGLHIGDYIHTVSNISKDNFKLEAAIPIMRKSITNIITGAGALVLAVVLKMYNTTNKLDIEFLNGFSLVLAAAGVVLFVAEAVRRSRIHAEEKKTIDALNAESFKGAEQIDGYSAERMFANEFDVSQDITMQMEQHTQEFDNDRFLHIDKNQSFAKAAEDFEMFARERGLKLSSDDVKKIFASITCSRLVVLHNMKSEDFEKLMLVLSGYFESLPYIDRVNDTYIGSSHMLFSADEIGNADKTNVSLAIDEAKKAKQVIHFAALDGVIPENLPLYFTPFVNYVKNPLGAYRISVLDDNHVETACYLPENLWFVLNVDYMHSVEQLPEFVSEVASVVSIGAEYCEPSEHHTQVRPFTYYQLDYLAERMASRFQISEDTWKKIDRLEEYVSERADFRIGNKLWLCLERYAYAYMACGAERDAAIDSAVSAKLLSPMVAAIKNVPEQDNKSLLDIIDMILGEQSTEECKAMISTFEEIDERVQEAERKAEEERLAALEAARKAEEERLAALEAARIAEEERRAALEEARKEEEAKAEAYLEARRAEEERLAAEEELRRAAALELARKPKKGIVSRMISVGEEKTYEPRIRKSKQSKKDEPTEQEEPTEEAEQTEFEAAETVEQVEMTEQPVAELTVPEAEEPKAEEPEQEEPEQEEPEQEEPKAEEPKAEEPEQEESEAEESEAEESEADEQEEKEEN